jgi:hypothetical protein
MTNSIINRGIEVFNEDGLFVFVKKTIQYIMRKPAAAMRPLLPEKGFQSYNSVKMGRARLGDSLLNQKTRSNIEDGLISGHEKYTQQGDSVVIIGGGNGVTAVRSAKMVGSGGEVIVFEGGKKSVESCKKVIEMNEVDDICTVNHAIIGQERNVYGGSTTSAELVSPTDLPECDVLEIDAEGSEIDIINKLEVSPRAVIVELHPWLYSESPKEPIELLEGMGYEIQYYSGHDGIEISQEEFDLLLQKSRDESNQKRGHVESGARWPVVAGGRLTS